MSVCLFMCEREYTLKLLKIFPVEVFGTKRALHLFWSFFWYLDEGSVNEKTQNALKKNL